MLVASMPERPPFTYGLVAFQATLCSCFAILLSNSYLHKRIFAENVLLQYLERVEQEQVTIEKRRTALKGNDSSQDEGQRTSRIPQIKPQPWLLEQEVNL